MRIFSKPIKTIDLVKYTRDRNIQVREIPIVPQKVDEQAIKRTIEDYIPKLNKIKGCNEYGVVITPTGEVFNDLRGMKYSISLSQTFILPNDSVLHQHPIEFKPFTRILQTLSPEDLRVFIGAKLHRIDAVDVSGGHYFLKRTPESPEFNKKLIKSAAEFIDDVDITCDNKIKHGYFETNEALNGFIKTCWNSFAEFFHLEYSHQEGQLSLLDRTKRMLNSIRENL